jgi:hypothetical protein
LGRGSYTSVGRSGGYIVQTVLVHHLRGNKGRCPGSLTELRVIKEKAEIIRWALGTLMGSWMWSMRRYVGHTEIRDLDHTTIFSPEKIGWLDISVNDPLLMNWKSLVFQIKNKRNPHTILKTQNNVTAYAANLVNRQNRPAFIIPPFYFSTGEIFHNYRLV